MGDRRGLGPCCSKSVGTLIKAVTQHTILMKLGGPAGRPAISVTGSQAVDADCVLSITTTVLTSRIAGSSVPSVSDSPPSGPARWVLWLIPFGLIRRPRLREVVPLT